jgi:hypothetical protein
MNQRKRYGYKIFVLRRGEWHGPYYNRPRRWKLKPGEIWTNRWLGYKDDQCGPGINYCPTLRKLLEWYDYWVRCLGLRSYGKLWVVYRIELLSGKVYPLPHYRDSRKGCSKLRTNRVRVVRAMTKKEVKRVLSAL